MATKKATRMVDESLIVGLYNALGIVPPQERALAKCTVVLEPGKPVVIDEITFPLIDKEDPAVEGAATAGDAPAAPAEPSQG